MKLYLLALMSVSFQFPSFARAEEVPSPTIHVWCANIVPNQSISFSARGMNSDGTYNSYELKAGGSIPIDQTSGIGIASFGVVEGSRYYDPRTQEWGWKAYLSLVDNQSAKSRVLAYYPKSQEYETYDGNTLMFRGLPRRLGLGQSYCSFAQKPFRVRILLTTFSYEVVR